MPKEKLFDTEAVLTKAMELFWKKGYHGTSINDLVDTTGLSRSSLYATFEDKHKLYVAALRHYQTLQKKGLTNELDKQSSARKKIEVIFRAYLEAILRDALGKGCFMVNTATEMTNQNKELAKIVGSDFEGMEELMYTLVKQGQSEGDISKKQKPKTLAHYLFSSYLGMRITGQAKPDRATLEDVVKVTLSVLD
jgi:TetR/AcrR family transcriptional repressor of nem operon